MSNENNEKRIKTADAGDPEQASRADGRAAAHAKKGGTAKKTILIVLLVVVLLFAALGITGYSIFRHYYNMMGRLDDIIPSEGFPTVSDLPQTTYDPTVPGLTEDEIKYIENEIKQSAEEVNKEFNLSDVKKNTKSFNILMIGVDAREDSFIGRSDSMIIISINRETKTFTMTSILRDVYVDIEEFGFGSINYAYYTGGTERLCKAIESHLGITIDRCVVTNFFLVADIVDGVGGIDLDLSAEEIEVMNNYIKEYNRLTGKAEGTDYLPVEDLGVTHVNGSQALAYARVRYVGTDFARTGRQRTIIMKCLEKFKSMGLSELNDFAGVFLPRIRTDLSASDCTSLLMLTFSLSEYKMQSVVIPADGTYTPVDIPGRGEVLKIDFLANAKRWYSAVENIR